MDSDTVRLADLEPAALTAAKAALEAAPPALPAAHPETAADLLFEEAARRRGADLRMRAYGEADGTAAAGVAATGRQPLVMIFPNGGLPPASEKTAERL